MKLTKKILKELIKEVMSEASGTYATGGGKRAGWKSKATQDAEAARDSARQDVDLRSSDYKTKKASLDTHLSAEPSRYEDIYDTPTGTTHYYGANRETGGGSKSTWAALRNQVTLDTRSGDARVATSARRTMTDLDRQRTPVPYSYNSRTGEGGTIRSSREQRSQWTTWNTEKAEKDAAQSAALSAKTAADNVYSKRETDFTSKEKSDAKKRTPKQKAGAELGGFGFGRGGGAKSAGKGGVKGKGRGRAKGKGKGKGKGKKKED